MITMPTRSTGVTCRETDVVGRLPKLIRLKQARGLRMGRYGAMIL